MTRQTGRYHVNNSGINCRTLPSTDGRKRARVVSGDLVDVIRWEGKWACIRHPLGVTWINRANLVGNALPGEDSPQVEFHASVIQESGQFVCLSTKTGILWCYGGNGWLTPVESSGSGKIPASEFRFESWWTRAVPGSRITQWFGVNPEYYEPYGMDGHDGIDEDVDVGDEILSVVDSEIYRVHSNSAPGASYHNWGDHVRVRKVVNGVTYKIIYCHLSRIDVAIGDIVTAGQVIGLGGNTGNVRPKPTPQNPEAGSHLHVAMKKDGGQPGWPYDLIDPTPFVLDYIRRKSGAD